MSRILLLLAGLGLLLAIVLQGLGGVESAPALEPTRTTVTPAPAADELASPSPQGQVPERRPEEEATPARPSEDPGGHPLTCLRAEDSAPLAGVRAYLAGAAVAGPSDADGRIRVPGQAWEKRVLWTPGRIPRVLAGKELPAELTFERATASLEVFLEEATPEHRIVRTQLQPRGEVSLPQGPWTPRLEEVSWGRLRADGMTEGRWDVYVWIAEGDSAPRSHSVKDVNIARGEQRNLELDVSRRGETDGEE